MEEKLQIGIMLDSGPQPLWIRRLVSDIGNLEAVNFRLCILFDHGHSSARGISMGYKIHRAVERLILKNRINYFLPGPVPEILQKSTVISLLLVGTNHNHKLTELSNSYLHPYNLDILLNFSSYTTYPGGFNPARFGIWQFMLDHNIEADCTSSVYWKTIRRQPVICLDLVCRNSRLYKDTLLYHGWLPVHFHSVELNLNRILSLFAIILVRLLNDLRQYGTQLYENKANINIDLPSGTRNEKDELPGIMASMGNMLIQYGKHTYERLTKKPEWKWFVVLKEEAEPSPVINQQYSNLIAPPGRFWADPFVLFRSGRVFIFVEEFIYKLGKGHISLLELDKERRARKLCTILESNSHISYPFVFVHEDCYYMIPETSGKKSIELYRCDEFPNKWYLISVLMDNIFALDTTLFQYDGKWWMFSAIMGSPAFPDFVELYLFYSNDFTNSAWISHPQNPIVTDIRNARPAGSLFMRNGKIYRPAQDCSIRYGRAIKLNEVKCLNETNYEEITVSTTEADWEPDLMGTHTFNFNDNITVMDAYKIESRFAFPRFFKVHPETPE